MTSRINREEYFALHSQQYVAQTFGGSLPAFLAAFSSHKKLSNQELDALKKLIDEMKG